MNHSFLLCTLLFLSFSQGQLITYNGFNNPASLWFEGEAFIRSDRDLQLTPADYNQRGHTLFANPFTLNDGTQESSFSVYFQFQLPDICLALNYYTYELYEQGADGIVFMIVKEIQPEHFTVSGGGLGYATVPNSAGIELDTWQNTEYGDTDDHHVGLDLNGDIESVIAHSLPFNLKDHRIYSVWIDYDGSKISAYVAPTTDPAAKPDTPDIQYPIVLSQTINSNIAYMGWSASTGGACESHRIKKWTVNNVCPTCASPSCTPSCVHGTCTSTNSCNCDDGWFGPSCNSPTIPTCTPSCVHGVCVSDNQCSCSAGWQGNDCNTPTCIHGTFNAGLLICQCEQGWTGPSCNLQSSTPTAAPTPTPTPSLIPCSSGTYGYASWPTSTNGVITGTCLDGYVGTPTRRCYPNGVWSTSVTPSCIPVTCAAISEAGAYFSSTLATTTATGTCLTGFTGSPTRACLANGQWDVIQNPCTANTCPVQNSYGYADWPMSPVGTATGTCQSGYSGNVTRKCLSSGTWSTSIIGSCTRNRCPAITEGNANWAQTYSNLPAASSCIAPYVGSPSRTCQANGTWSAILNPCQLGTSNCVGGRYGLQVFPNATNGETAVGVCVPKSKTDSGLPPKRKCTASGEWQTLVVDICQLWQCPPTTQGNANFPAVNYGTWSVGTCTGTTTGSPRLFCDTNAQWAQSSGSCA